MKLTESQLRRIIQEELLMSEILGLPSVKSRWKTNTSSGGDLHDTAALIFARENFKKANDIINKIGRSPRRTNKILNSPVGKGAATASAKALLGTIRKFTRKLGKPLRVAGKALKVLSELQRIANLVNRGALSSDTALELFGKSFAGHAIDQAVAILSFGLGGLFGPIVASALEPLSSPFHDRVNQMNNDLDAAYEAANWVGIIEKDPELKTIFDSEMPEEITKAAEKIGDDVLADRAREDYSTHDALGIPRVRQSSVKGGSAKAVGPVKGYDPSTLPHGVLSKGTPRENGVALLQRGLAQAGAWSGGETGIFDDKLRQALKSFQRDAGIKADGIYGPNTKNKIVSGIEAIQSGRMIAEGKMKITRKQLRQIIRESLRLLESNSDSDYGKKLDPDLLKGAYVSSKEDREAMKDYIAKLDAKKRSIDSIGSQEMADAKRAVGEDPAAQAIHLGISVDDWYKIRQELDDHYEDRHMEDQMAFDDHDRHPLDDDGDGNVDWDELGEDSNVQEGTETSKMLASWQQILGTCLD